MAKSRNPLSSPPLAIARRLMRSKRHTIAVLNARLVPVSQAADARCIRNGDLLHPGEVLGHQGTAFDFQIGFQHVP
jgi:hypothetical protein